MGLRNDVPAILKESDVFTLSSVTEGMSMTLMEAMALGLPVAVTDIPGNRALVEHGKTGLLFKPNDVKALSTLLTALLDDAPLRRRLGTNARNFVMENFPFTRMGEKTAGIYERLFEKASRGFEKSSQVGYKNKKEIRKERT